MSIAVGVGMLAHKINNENDGNVRLGVAGYGTGSRYIDSINGHLIAMGYSTI